MIQLALKDDGVSYFHLDPSMSTLCKQQCSTEKPKLTCPVTTICPRCPTEPPAYSRPDGSSCWAELSKENTPPIHPLLFICCPVQAEQNNFSSSIPLACRAWAEIPASSPGHMEPSAATFSRRCSGETEIFVGKRKKKKGCSKPLMCSHSAQVGG